MSSLKSMSMSNRDSDSSSLASSSSLLGKSKQSNADSKSKRPSFLSRHLLSSSSGDRSSKSSSHKSSSDSQSKRQGYPISGVGDDGNLRKGREIDKKCSSSENHTVYFSFRSLFCWCRQEKKSENLDLVRVDGKCECRMDVRWEVQYTERPSEREKNVKFPSTWDPMRW